MKRTVQSEGQSAARRRPIAIIDPGSFVLPYVFHLVRALAASGPDVEAWVSETRYNAEFLTALRATPGVQVHARAISGSVVPRWRGALAYLAQLLHLLLRARRCRMVNLQWVGVGLWPLDACVFGWALRAMRVPLALTVHNAVPHGYGGREHAHTRWLAERAERLIFISVATRDDFLQRYGEHFSPRCRLLPHGLLPVQPDAPTVPFAPLPRPEALVFWGRVQPYKGVELFAELARDQAFLSRGLPLEIHGAWAPELHPLRDELREAGVLIHDEYLDDRALLALLQRPVLFVLPYQRATQSGAMYALLNHGCTFLGTDTGDVGDFLRRPGLEALRLPDRNAGAVNACLDRLEAESERIATALNEAQQQAAWTELLARHPEAYDA